MSTSELLERLNSASIGSDFPIMSDLRIAIRKAIRDGAAGVPGIGMAMALSNPPMNVPWGDLSSSERILLRFVWEAAYRTPCPLPLRP